MRMEVWYSLVHLLNMMVRCHTNSAHKPPKKVLLVYLVVWKMKLCSKASDRGEEVAFKHPQV